MVTLMLLALVTQHPGGPPSDWLPLSGEPKISYRWSRPSANSCMVEFESGERGNSLRFDVVAKILSSRPDAPVYPKESDRPAPEPTIIKPQTVERKMSIEVIRMGRNSETIHECYGVLSLQARAGKANAPLESEPLTNAQPK